MISHNNRKEKQRKAEVKEEKILSYTCKQIREIVSNSPRLLIIFDKLDIKSVFLYHSLLLSMPGIILSLGVTKGGWRMVEAIKKFHKNDLEGI